MWILIDALLIQLEPDQRELTFYFPLFIQANIVFVLANLQEDDVPVLNHAY